MKKFSLLLVASLFAFLPFVVDAGEDKEAIDDNITSVSNVTITDKNPGVDTSYGITLSFGSEELAAEGLGSGDVITIMVANSEDYDPTASGYSFENTTLGPMVGLSGTGAAYEKSGNYFAYTVTLDAAPAALSASI